MCDRCQALEARVKALEAEVKQLRKLLKLAVRIIKRQKKQLDQARLVTWSIISKARQTMSDGNLPRAQYAYHKGKLEAAARIYREMYIDYASRFLELIGNL